MAHIDDVRSQIAAARATLDSLLPQLNINIGTDSTGTWTLVISETGDSMTLSNGSNSLVLDNNIGVLLKDVLVGLFT